MIVSTEGITIKSMDYRETSRIATFFTKSHGKVTGVLKGIRKDPKKFGSSVDRFTVNDIVYYEYKRSDLHLVSQCDLKQFYYPIRQDYKKTMAATYALELVDTIIQPGQPHLDIYHLLTKFFAELGTAKDVDKLVYIFQIKILGLSGFKPHLDSCVKCSCKVKGQTKFSLRAGGLVCQDCPDGDAAYEMISSGTISSLMHIEKSGWKNCLRIGFTNSVRYELKFLLNNFLVYHLEKKIKSARYL